MPIGFILALSGLAILGAYLFLAAMRTGRRLAGGTVSRSQPPSGHDDEDFALRPRGDLARWLHTVHRRTVGGSAIRRS